LSNAEDAKTALAAKKAEVEKLLEEFDWHCRRVPEIIHEASRLIGSFPEFVKEHGAEGVPVAIELYQKLHRIAAKHERLKSGGASSDVV
jgi:hypothetical protein